MSKIIVTSALPYIHKMPHLGNIIGSVLPADVYYRFQRLLGKDVIYICGSDSHGTMHEIEAKKKNISTEELVYQNHERIQKLFKKLNLDFSYYGITDSEENRKLTNKIFEELLENRLIRKQEMELAYCKRCKKFLADRWIEGECPICGGLARGDQCNDCSKLLRAKKIINPYCVHCNSKEIKFKKSMHLFFKLPELEEWLKGWFKGKAGNKLTEGETYSWLRKGLDERCISRDAEWGFPILGFEDKVFYVWFDAPIGYIAATRNWANKNGEKWKDWWQSEDVELVQFMGKDNIFFHTIIFPAILKGSGEPWTLPSKVMASAHLLGKDVKFSKSRGKGLTTEDAFKIRPADYWRFVLLSLYPRRSDKNFSLSYFRRKINSELVNTLGNFIHRTLKFIYSNFGSVPSVKLQREEKKFFSRIQEAIDRIGKLLQSFKFDSAIAEVVRISSKGNKYFQKQEPWKTKDSDPERCKRTMLICANLVRSLAIILEPFLPTAAEQIWSQLQMQGSVHEASWNSAKELGLKGKEIKKPKPLFEKVRKEEIKVNYPSLTEGACSVRSNARVD